jgi:hypothetical protein
MKKTETRKPKQNNEKTPDKPADKPAKTPAHQWTNGGEEVLLLRCINADGTSYGGFVNSVTVGERIEAPDWDGGENKCGGGLHGWPWGIGIGGGKNPDYAGIWQVLGCKPSEIVEVTEDPNSVKSKTKGGILRYSSKPGDWHGAVMHILSGQMAWVAHNADGVAATSGVSSSAATSGVSSSAATSGDSSSAATSGYSSSAATSGVRSSAATSGDRSSAATSGDRSSAATSGYSSSAATSGVSSSAATSGVRSSAATSGDSSPAVCAGINSRAKAGPWGCIALAWWHENEKRSEMRCREVGCGDGSDGKLKAGVWYRLDSTGNFVEEK